MKQKQLALVNSKWKIRRSMQSKPRKSGTQSLRAYEMKNLRFFLSLIVVLGLVVTVVMQAYKNSDKPREEESGVDGVVSEAVSPVGDTCIFYLTTEISGSSLKFRNRLEVPVTDDGLVSGFFDIPGVAGVVIDKRMVMIQKSPSAKWGSIQLGAREVIKNHLHPH
jgi:hypothetical protein